MVSTDPIPQPPQKTYNPKNSLVSVAHENPLRLPQMIIYKIHIRSFLQN